MYSEAASNIITLPYIIIIIILYNMNHTPSSLKPIKIMMIII